MAGFWFVVSSWQLLDGATYASQEEAEAAIAALPEHARKTAGARYSFGASDYKGPKSKQQRIDARERD